MTDLARRRALRSGVLLVVALFVLPGPLASQEGPGTHRKWIYALVGGLVVGVPAALSSAFIDTGGGGCSQPECFAPIAAAMGAGVGFLVGAERDEDAVRAFVAGPVVELESEAPMELPVVPVRAIPFRRGALVVGERGLALVDSARHVTPIRGVRGLTDAAVLSESGVVIGASSRALFAFPMDVAGVRARQVFDEGAARLASDGKSRLLWGGVSGLRIFDVSGTGADLSFAEDLRTPPDGAPSRLLWPEGEETIWVLAEDRLQARRAGNLEMVGSVTFPSRPISVNVGDGVAVAAAGASGVYVVDISDPASPRLVGRYEGVNYAWDAAIHGDEAFVAAGTQGLVRLDVSTPSDPRVTAVVRNLGDPTTVLVSGNELMLIDRHDRGLRRVPLERR